MGATPTGQEKITVGVRHAKDEAKKISPAFDRPYLRGRSEHRRIDGGRGEIKKLVEDR